MSTSVFVIASWLICGVFGMLIMFYADPEDETLQVKDLSVILAGYLALIASIVSVFQFNGDRIILRKKKEKKE